jgi:lysophospholipase L1-like esterase
MLFVGSCFADNIGKRFTEEKFRALVNPFGVMYNPVSILHTVSRLVEVGGLPFAANEPGTVVLTLGTNHVYRLKATGEIVDNCQKRPQKLFQEEELSVEQCTQTIRQCIAAIRSTYSDIRFLLTVSPIRYRKYGYHGSQLSKATLLLAIDNVIRQEADPCIAYFPSYEIVNDELRDYRFYQPDMLHPSDQAVDYIYERLAAVYFSSATTQFLQRWEPIREALAHRPFHPESDAYQSFLLETQKKFEALKKDYPMMEG